MGLAALICAYHETDDGSALRATLPLAGRTLVERQARLAAAVGAQPVVVIVERVPAALAAALDRLRSEGVAAIVARSAADAAEAIPPEERLLLIADGLVSDSRHFTRFGGIPAPAVLTLPGNGSDDRHERIDAEARWAGLVMLDGAALRDTVAELGDWDLQSTLLRRAIQAGARHYAVRGDSDGLLAIASSEAELADAEQDIVAAAGGPGEGWASRWLLAPIERAVTRALMPSAVGPEWLYLSAAALTALCAFLFARGWLWAGGILMLLTTPLDGTAERLAAVRLQDGRPPGWWRHVIPLAASAALLALGWTVGRDRGWGCVALAAVTLLFQMALRGELHGHETPARDWLADRKGLTWLMLPFGVTGQWMAGLGAQALYAIGSFFWAQREAHRPAGRAKED